MAWLKGLKEKMAAKARKSRIKSLVDKSRFDLLLADVLYEPGRELGSGLGGEVTAVTIEGKEYALKETEYVVGTQEEDFAKNDAHFGTLLDHPLVLKYLATHTEEAGTDEEGKRKMRTRILQPLADCDLHDALNDGHFHEPCTWPNIGKILRTFLRLVQAVEYMHSRHVVHLDLKHANVLVRNAAADTPDILLCDFGFCIQMPGPDAMHELASACGTDGYYAPEVVPGIWTYQRNRVSTATLKSDIYALGVMLWEMITAKQVMRKVTQADGTRLLERDSKFPALSGSPWSTPMSVREGGFRVLHQLDWLIRKMTRDDHFSRPNATQVIVELAEIIAAPNLHILSHPDPTHLQPCPFTPPVSAPCTPEHNPEALLATHKSNNLFSPLTTTTNSPSVDFEDRSPAVAPLSPTSHPTTPLSPHVGESGEEGLTPKAIPMSPMSPLETFPAFPIIFSDRETGSSTMGATGEKSPTATDGASTLGTKVGEGEQAATKPSSTDASPRIAARRTARSVGGSDLISPRGKAASLWSRLTGGHSTNSGSAGTTTSNSTSVPSMPSTGVSPDRTPASSVAGPGAVSESRDSRHEREGCQSAQRCDGSGPSLSQRPCQSGGGSWLGIVRCGIANMPAVGAY